MKYDIKELHKEEYQGYRLPISFESQEAYVLRRSHNKSEIYFKLVREPLESPIVNEDEGYDLLFQDHWDNARAWGVMNDGTLIAAIETSEENWNNRLRITELWVDDHYQRQGLGTLLMNKVKDLAKKDNRRALVLETQSSNVNAIDFYISNGFELIGFDTIHYSNDDVKNNIFRLEMGYIIEREEDETR